MPQQPVPSSPDPASDPAVGTMRAAVARFGPALAADARLCRRVLSDLMPMDTALVAALTAVAATGLPVRLAESTSTVELRASTARALDEVIATHGLRQELVQRAIALWAASVGADPTTAPALAAPRMLATRSVRLMVPAETEIVRSASTMTMVPPASPSTGRWAAVVGIAAAVVVATVAAVLFASLVHLPRAIAATDVSRQTVPVAAASAAGVAPDPTPPSVVPLAPAHSGAARRELVTTAPAWARALPEATSRPSPASSSSATRSPRPAPSASETSVGTTPAPAPSPSITSTGGPTPSDSPMPVITDTSSPPASTDPTPPPASTDPTSPPASTDPASPPASTDPTPPPSSTSDATPSAGGTPPSGD